MKVFAFALAGLMAIGGPVSAQENPLPFDTETTDPAWTAVVNGGWYVMRNQTDPNSLVYRFGDFLEPDATDQTYRTTVFVEAAEGTFAGAGLIFNYEPEFDGYTAWMLMSDGLPNLVVRDAEGQSDRPGDGSIVGRMDGTDVLSVHLRAPAGEVDFLLNGDVVHTVVLEADPRDNPIGIVAFGMGRVGYWGWALE